jgi:hypothetical protein
MRHKIGTVVEHGPTRSLVGKRYSLGDRVLAREPPQLQLFRCRLSIGHGGVPWIVKKVVFCWSVVSVTPLRTNPASVTILMVYVGAR